MDSIPLNFYQSASYSWHSNNDKNGVERFFRAVGAVFSGAIGQYKVTVADATSYIDKFGGKDTWAGQALIKYVAIKERKAALVGGSAELPSVRLPQAREVPEKGASTPAPLTHSVSAVSVDKSDKLPGVSQPQIRQVPVKGVSTLAPLKVSMPAEKVQQQKVSPAASPVSETLVKRTPELVTPSGRNLASGRASTGAVSASSENTLNLLTRSHNDKPEAESAHRKVAKKEVPTITASLPNSVPAEKMQQRVSPAASPVSEIVVKPTPELVSTSGRNLASDGTSTGAVSANSGNRLNFLRRSLNDTPEAGSAHWKVAKKEVSTITASSATSITDSANQYGAVDSKPAQVVHVIKQNFFSQNDDYTKNSQAFEKFSQTILDKNIVGLVNNKFPEFNVTETEKFIFRRKNTFMGEIKLLMVVQSKKENLLKLMKDANKYEAEGNVEAEELAKVEFVKVCIENQRTRISANLENREYENTKQANLAGSSAVVKQGVFTPEKAFAILKEHKKAAYKREDELDQKYLDEKEFADELDNAIRQAKIQYLQPGGGRDIKDHTLQALEKQMMLIIDLATGDLIIPGEVAEFPGKKKQYEEYAKKLHQHYLRISEYRQSHDPNNPRESENIQDILQTILQLVEVQNYCRSQLRLDDSERLQQLA